MAYFGATKDVGMFCAAGGKSLRVFGEREIEDHGTFGVFWYRRPTGHTKTSARHHGDTPLATEWAFVLKGDDGAWRVGASVPGFATRETAVDAATKVKS